LCRRAGKGPRLLAAQCRTARCRRGPPPTGAHPDGFEQGRGTVKRQTDRQTDRASHT
jgi:hypothetical protein